MTRRGILPLLFGAVALLTSSAVVPSAPAATGADTRPNIVVVIVDDMRLDQMGAMPQVRRLFANGGTTFPKALVSDPMCCPSRASIMTGRYVHNHGVKGNTAGWAQQLDQTTTIQHHLQDGGYRTALVGKYLNGWPLTTPPPDFDRWAVLQSGDTYINPWFDVDGERTQLTGHSTDLIGQMAIGDLRDFEANDDAPFLMYLNPYSPHGPATPSPGDELLPVPAWPGNPAVFEADRSDKPPLIRSQTTSLPQAAATMKLQRQSAYGADRMIGRVFAELDRLGETNTLAFFMSDNGVLLGEHGVYADKRLPYAAATRVPLLMRWPGHVATGKVDQRMASLVDIVPTILVATGLVPPLAAPPRDGRTLFGLGGRQRALVEWEFDGDMPSWASNETATYRYTEWYEPRTGVAIYREYYDLANDPWELTNLIHDNDPLNDPDIGALAAQLSRDRLCRGTVTSAACP